MSEIRFEMMSDDYLAQAADIYNYYVKNTTVTFHMELQSPEDMKEILYQDDPLYISYAILDGETLCGYAYMAPYKKREAYRISSEVTIYLRPESCKKGIGGKALKLLDQYAKESGIHSFLAIICAENVSSIQLFSKNGYEKCAYFKEVGMKFGRMLDIIAMQKILN